MSSFVTVAVASNVIIFSMFFAMISSELMAASSMLFRYSESTKKVIPFIVPIWEITGTFFVFYAVNMESLVPDVLPLLAYAFIDYILIFLILYVGRNSAIILAEFIWKNRYISRKTLYRIYSIITYLLGTIILIVYTALISGKGVNYAATTFNFAAFVGYLPDDTFIIGSAILLFGLASVFYGLNVNRFLPLIVVVAGLVLAGVSFLDLHDISSPYFLIVPIILTLLAPIMYIFPSMKKIVSNKIVFQGLLAITSFFLIYSLYPWLLGKTLSINSLLNTSVMMEQIFYATIVGGAILAVLTYVFFRVAYSKRNPAKPVDPGEMKLE